MAGLRCVRLKSSGVIDAADSGAVPMRGRCLDAAQDHERRRIDPGFRRPDAIRAGSVGLKNENG
jgi:hypothetical protein